jgi:NitT/TauT family transport system ATP-binding protein
MDEPFASVDAQTRSDLEDLVLDVRRRYDMTMLVVTHDIDEAVYLADRVVVLSRSPSRVVSVVDVELPPERDRSRPSPRPASLSCAGRSPSSSGARGAAVA